MTDDGPLEAACEQAWLAYNAAVRDLPDCEHVRAWRERVDELRGKHLAAIRECDRAQDAGGPGPRPLAVVRPEPPRVPEPVPAACQGALFEIEGAA